METLILDSKQIEQKIERIAYEIYENSHNESQLLIGGIKGNGFEFAQRLVSKLEIISKGSYPKGINLFEVSVNKANPLNHSIDLSISDNDLTNNSIILVDDVINSGSTLIHATSRILQQSVKNIKTAILVNRTHRRYPILADYVGLDITTTIQNNIVVEFGENEKAYLV